MIAIIDYDAGNLKSVEKALAYLGEESVITRDFHTIEQADKVILPGVGSFGVAMDNLKRYELDKVIHIGWNSLHLQNNGRLFQNVPMDAYVYFVHSYYLQAKHEEIVKATTEYGVTIHASVEQDNIFACQFHPEKSSSVGLKILKNFASLQGGVK